MLRLGSSTGEPGEASPGPPPRKRCARASFVSGLPSTVLPSATLPPSPPPALCELRRAGRLWRTGGISASLRQGRQGLRSLARASSLLAHQLIGRLVGAGGRVSKGVPPISAGVGRVLTVSGRLAGEGRLGPPDSFVRLPTASTETPATGAKRRQSITKRRAPSFAEDAEDADDAEDAENVGMPTLGTRK